MSNGVEGPGYPLMSRSYADLITEFYETRDPRKTSDQQNFRTACINAYGSSRNQEGKVEIWDYVLREYVDPDLMTAAHITPFFIRNVIMERVFGPEHTRNYSVPRTGWFCVTTLRRNLLSIL